MILFLKNIGNSFFSLLEGIGLFSLFVFETIRWIFRPPFDLKNLLHQINEIGVKSIPVGVVSSFFVGMVMALQLGGPLEQQIQGISSFMGGGISLAMVRELAPVLTSVLLAGRIGSSIAAEIGTMKVTEQIDALTTLATNPIQYLSVPRFLASVFSLPLITMMSITVGVFGGALVSYATLDISFASFYENAQQFVQINDLLSGLSKTIIFGGEIALISCFTGFQASGGAAGVGKAAIQSVVYSFMMIIISDYFVTYTFQLFGF